MHYHHVPCHDLGRPLPIGQPTYLAWPKRLPGLGRRLAAKLSVYTITKKIRPSIDHSILSPSGWVSKRARQAALNRAAAELFAEWGGHLPKPEAPPTDLIVQLKLQAAELRQLAARGMKPRAYLKKAIELEAEADRLDGDRTS